jgi:lipopolysaccharide/colanic/teichoic acid biosynthesis glycosyltransferase
MDVAGALIALVLFGPVMLLVAIAVRICLGSPVIFRQVRPGLDERTFVCWKFRTMRDAVDRLGRALPDAERLTRLGSLLRATSLDELPQLFNVLRGEMSLVGPRPLLVDYLPLYSPQQRRRHEVLPGITGWAQINGRNSIGWEEKFRLDIWYVDHWSPWLDAWILLRTVGKVLRPEGVNQPGHATFVRFTGPSVDPTPALEQRQAA